MIQVSTYEEAQILEGLSARERAVAVTDRPPDDEFKAAAGSGNCVRCRQASETMGAQPTLRRLNAAPVPRGARSCRRLDSYR